MNVAGIDYSISSPSICIYDSLKGKLSFDTCVWYFNQQGITKKEMQRRNDLSVKNIFWSNRFETVSNEERYYYLADWALSILLMHNVSCVSIEDYALEAKGKVFNIAEATGLLKHYMFLNDINIFPIAPTLNKKLFSGFGNANKEKMITTFNDKNSLNISELFGLKKDFTGSPISDIVDSYSLIESYFNIIGE